MADLYGVQVVALAGFVVGALDDVIVPLVAGVEQQGYRLSSGGGGAGGGGVVVSLIKWVL